MLSKQEQYTNCFKKTYQMDEVSRFKRFMMMDIIKRTIRLMRVITLQQIYQMFNHNQFLSNAIVLVVRNQTTLGR